MLLPEIEAVGIYNSQTAARGVVLSKNRKTSMFEIEMPMEKGGISYIGQESSEITADMLICAKPGQLRHTRFPFKCRYIHMYVRDEYLSSVLLELPNFIRITDVEKYALLFERIRKHYEMLTRNEEIILQSLVLELIYRLKGESYRQHYIGTDAGSENSIYGILKYIKENLSEELSLERVAEYAALSPVYFHKCFKKAVGKTLREYVEEQRIKKALGLLAEGELTVTQIAYACGFSSQSYFNYAFKRKMKTTPRKYINQVNSAYEK